MKLMSVQKRIFYKQFNQFLFIVVSFILLTSFKNPGPIVLPDEPILFQPKEFYIAGVRDESVEKSAEKQLVIKEPANQTATRVDLQGGVSVAISKFIERNLSKDESLRPVIISIKEFKVTESSLTGNRIDGHVKLSLSFGLQKIYGLDHLIDYQGGLHYVRNGVSKDETERHLKSLLKNGLVYFNDWMKTNADFNRKLARSVKISFTDYKEKIEGDTIYYSADRLLTWADFQSNLKPSGRFQAAVMPSVGYDQQAEMIKGVINVNIALKTFVPKSACWANIAGRDNYALNHEQKHFDIVKIISEQFKRKVLAEKLTPDTFEAFINMQYLDSFREMDTMQKSYDKETGHGTNNFAQALWNDRVKKDLGVK